MGRAGWMVLFFFACVSAWGQQEKPARELIYGAELMTPEEREQYRRDMRAATDAPAQAKLRARNRERMRERARQRGVQLKDPEGVVRR